MWLIQILSSIPFDFDELFLFLGLSLIIQGKITHTWRLQMREIFSVNKSQMFENDKKWEGQK